MTTQVPAVVPKVPRAEGGEERSPTPPHDSPRTGRRWWPAAVCLALYTLGAVLEFGWSTSPNAGHLLGSPEGVPDQIQQIWFLEWAQYSLAHLHNPFFSAWQGYPLGVNSLVVPSMLALGVVLSPITALFGPIVTWNVLAYLSLILSAFTMCLVVRRWTNWWPAAFLGGLLYGFSTWSTSELSHLFLCFAPLPPLIFLLLHEILFRQQWRPARAGALLGALCGAQYLISSEVLASTLLMGASATILYLIVCRSDLRTKLPYIKRGVTFSVLVGGALLAYPVLFTFFGPEHLKSVPQLPIYSVTDHSDLLSPFIPGFAEWIGAYALHVIVHVPNFYVGSVLYMGIPLVIALAAIVVWLRRVGIVLFAGALAAIAFIFSLGSRLYVDGHNTHIPLPFIVFEHIPGVDGLVPVRFALYIGMFAGFIFAVGLDELHGRLRQRDWSKNTPENWHRAAAALAPMALAAIVVIPLLPQGSEPPVSTPASAFFTSHAVSSIKPGSVVLTYPYPQYGLSANGSQAADVGLLDQAVSGMRYKVVGGYGWWLVPNTSAPFTSPPPLRPLSVQALFDASFYGTATAAQAALLSTGDITRDLRRFIEQHKVDAVVVLPVGRYPSLVTAAVTAAIGAPTHSGGVTVWFNAQHRVETVAPKGRAVPIPPPVASVLKPATGSQLTGTQLLAASASAEFGVRRVEFRVTGDGRTVNVPAVRLFYGWIAQWNTTSSPNGDYMVYAVAHGMTGLVTASAGVPVHVKN